MKQMRLLMVAGLAVASFLAFAGPALAAPAAKATPTPVPAQCSKDAAGKCNSLLLTAQPCVKISLPIFAGDNKCVDNSASAGGAIVVYLKSVLKLASGTVGIVIVLMLVIAGIQYITSIGDPSRIKSAKNRIQNAMIALLLFLMMFAILQFLVPGGLF